jgi:signal transduction histidine kinase
MTFGRSFDPVQLRRILFVLAARARDAIGDGGEFALLGGAGEITPEEAATYAYPVTPGDYALLQVRDTGAALSASETATIFEPFAHDYAADATGLELGSVYGP